MYELCMVEQIYFYHHQPLIAFTDVRVLSIHILSSVCNFDMSVCVCVCASLHVCNVDICINLTFQDLSLIY